VVASFFTVEFNKKTLTIDLIQGHVERTLSGDVNILAIDIVIDFWDFKHERRVKADLFVFGEVRNQELFELATAETLNFQQSED